MIKIKITGLSANYYEGELNLVHIVCPNGDGEHTICGDAYVDEIYEKTKEKVNCPHCLTDMKRLIKLAKDFEKELLSKIGDNSEVKE
jgi:hypothetical protein